MRPGFPVCWGLSRALKATQAAGIPIAHCSAQISAGELNWRHRPELSLYVFTQGLPALRFHC